MNKGIAIVAVVVLVTAVFLLMRDSSRDSESSSGPRKGQIASEIMSQPSGEGTVSTPRRPTLRSVPTVTGDRDPGQVYIREDGAEVRDHRKNPPERKVEGEKTPPPAVQPITLMEVRRAIRPAVKECILSFAGGAPDGSKATAVLTVSIVSEQLKIDSLDLSMDEEWDAEAFRDCIGDRVVGHGQTVTGAKDVAAHQMTFPYNL